MRKETEILYETSHGYVTLEQTGKSQSYVVWRHGAVAATKRATIGADMANAFARARAVLDDLACTACGESGVRYGHRGCPDKTSDPRQRPAPYDF